MRRSIIASVAVAAVALGAAVPAAAQNYGQPYPYTAHTGYASSGYQDGYAYRDGYRDYDDRYRQDYAYGGDGYDAYQRCEQERRDRQVAGGVIGAGVGALAGSGVASRNARTEGGVLGAVVGAVAGSAIGRSTACDPRGGYQVYDDRYGYDRGYDTRYDDRRYDTGYRDYGYDYDRSYDYGSGYGYGYGYPASSGYAYGSGDRCTTRQTRTYDRYGREQVREVRTCRQY